MLDENLPSESMSEYLQSDMCANPLIQPFIYDHLTTASSTMLPYSFPTTAQMPCLNTLSGIQTLPCQAQRTDMP